MSTHENKVTKFATRVGHTIAHLVDDVEPDTISTSAPIASDGHRAKVMGCNGH